MIHDFHSECRHDGLDTARKYYLVGENAFIFRSLFFVLVDKRCSYENDRLKELLNSAHAHAYETNV